MTGAMRNYSLPKALIALALPASLASALAVIAAAATAAASLFARSRFIDVERSAVELLVVHRRDRCIRLIRVHVHEAEASTVHDAGIASAERGKRIRERRLRCVVGEIPYVECFCSQNMASLCGLESFEA